MKRVVLAFALCFTILVLLAGSLPVGKTQNNSRIFGQSEAEERFPNYDVRLDESKEGQTLRAKHRQKLTDTQKNRIAALQQAMGNAQNSLRNRVQGLEVLPNPLTGGPEVVGVSTANRAFLTPPADSGYDEIVLSFLGNHATLYGLTPAEIEKLPFLANYVNPAGNLAWVTLEQEYNRIPVFGAELRAALTTSGELVRTVSSLAAGLDKDELLTKPALSAAEAVALAAASVNVKLAAQDLVVKTSSRDGHQIVFEPGPFDEDIRVQLVYFPLETGLADLAWSVTLWQREPVFYAVVDAELGHLLYRKNLTEHQTQNASYAIYNDDSPAPFSPFTGAVGGNSQSPGINRSVLTLISELPAFNNLGWITDGNNSTLGNNVDAGLDLDGINGIDANGRAVGAPFRVFNFAYNPPPLGTEPPTLGNYRLGVVTDLFFWSNRFHDVLYQYGFTEGARNFQNDNFGRGGLGGDYVRAEAQDSSGTNNANFAVGPDGQPPRMQMYVFDGPTPDRDGDLDHEIVIHELTHGLSNRLHANTAGLTSNIARGMGEGWSDFYARALLSTSNEDVNGIYALGGYATLAIEPGFTDNYYYGIRRFPYAVKTNLGTNGKPHNPLTLADVDPGQINLTDGAHARGPIGSGSASAVHNIGEVWCMALLEARARIITRLGFTAGNARSLQLVTDGMKLDPNNPHLLQGRDAILAADCASFNGEDERDIWAGFAARGMGYGAQYNGGDSWTESFAVPNLNLGNVSFSDAACNNNGIADPGETLTLSVPLTNPFCATNATNVTATIAGGGSANYGTISAGSGGSQNISFTVPQSTVCGTRLNLTLTLNSNLGQVIRNISLFVGQPVTTYTEYFDGVGAPALPNGWTSSVNGGASDWVTTDNQPDTLINTAFAAGGGATGESILTSAPRNITSPNARLSFRQNYSFEAGFDGGVLEIKIGNGAFADIIAAGGSFLTGGYSGKLANSATCASPLGGRNAWTGNSSNFLTTTVFLPTAAAGQTVQFRWRAGYDCNQASGGWRIDTLTLAGNTNCTPCGGGCSYEVAPLSQAFVAAGGNSMLSVTANSGCAWTAVSNAPWINITGGATGNGSGVVQFAVLANNGPARSSSMTIAGQTFLVTQDSGCSFQLTPASQSFGAGGGGGTINVTSGTGCTWTAASNDAWITINNGTPGNGNGSVNYSVGANSGPQRTGTITIAGQTFTITQASNCTYAISPTSQTFGATGGNGAVTVTAGAGCTWSATSNNSWLQVTGGSSGTGNGMVNFSVSANTGVQRTGSLTIAGQTFTVTQGAACTFAISPTNRHFSNLGGADAVAVTTASGCAWQASSNANWLTITSGAQGSGNGQVNYSVAPNSGSERTGTLTIAGLTFTVTQGTQALARKSDFDGDGKADLAVWRGFQSNWLIIKSATNTLTTTAWGAQYLPYNDLATPGDYDGDGKTDLAVWRRADNTWYIIRSSDGQTVIRAFGQAGDTPVPGDYDGDGITDLAVWRGLQSTWEILQSSTNTTRIVIWGASYFPYQDVPVPADYDGDGKTDVAVFRPFDGNWYIIQSSNSSVRIQALGIASDTPVPGDFDGDGKTDLAVWRGQQSTWYILRSTDNQIQTAFWGASYFPYNDIPVPADYDGDGKFDIAVWRPLDGTWYIVRSANGATLTQQHGQSGDTPIPTTGVR